MNQLIAIKGLSIKQKQFALTNISFSLECGYLTGLLGENGSGKSTLLRILGGMEDESCGQAVLSDVCFDISSALWKQKTAYVSAEETLYLEKSLLENGKLLGTYYDDWDMEYYREVLYELDLPEESCPLSHSKGNRMKCKLAFAIAHRPALLLLDEPTAGFDPIFRKEFDRLLQKLLAEDMAVLMSTHMTGDLEKIGDYFMYIEAGKLLFLKDREELEKKYGGGIIGGIYDETFKG